jgi:hypothetical protein
VKTRKKDKCPPSVSARVVGPTKGRSGALRPVGSSPQVLRGGDRFFLPSRPGSPGGASNSSRWANGEANSGSRDLASRDVSKRRVRNWKSCIVPWWTSLSVRLIISFSNADNYLSEWESRRLFAGFTAGR